MPCFVLVRHRPLTYPPPLRALQEPPARGSDMWHSVLRLMGGDFKELSMNVRAQEERGAGRGTDRA